MHSSSTLSLSPLPYRCVIAVFFGAASLLAQPSGSGISSLTTQSADAQVLLRGLFRSYEPTQIGWTEDEGLPGNLDFTFSTMFPLVHGYYPDRKAGYDCYPNWWSVKPYPYLAATVREGFYVGTLPSGPVVGKRFNPLLAIRFWSFQPAHEQESLHQFVEFVAYAHESNGKDIANPVRFARQVATYRSSDTAISTDADKEAFYRARQNISRGWDYWGVHISREFKVKEMQVVVLGRFDYYLRHGLLQGPAEEYNSWEKDPTGRRRRHYDGLSVRTSVQFAMLQPFHWVEIDRVVFTLTTGTQGPFQYLTGKLEGGFRLGNLPFVLWCRKGFNRDLVDYYKRSTSVGLAASFWDF